MFQEQQKKSLDSYQAQGRKMGRRSRVEDASERRMAVFKLTEGCQAAKISKGGGNEEIFSKESELKNTVRGWKSATIISSFYFIHCPPLVH